MTSVSLVWNQLKDSTQLTLSGYKIQENPSFNVRIALLLVVNLLFIERNQLVYSLQVTVCGNMHMV